MLWQSFVGKRARKKREKFFAFHNRQHSFLACRRKMVSSAAAPRLSQFTNSYFKKGILLTEVSEPNTTLLAPQDRLHRYLQMLIDQLTQEIGYNYCTGGNSFIFYKTSSYRNYINDTRTVMLTGRKVRFYSLIIFIPRSGCRVECWETCKFFTKLWNKFLVSIVFMYILQNFRLFKNNIEYRTIIYMRKSTVQYCETT